MHPKDAFELNPKSQEAPSKRLVILTEPALPALSHATAGAIGASVSNSLTDPLSLLFTRLQIQRQLLIKSSTCRIDAYQNVFDASIKIYEQEDGIRGSYSGATGDTVKTSADSFLFFLMYHFTRKLRKTAHQLSG